MLRVKDEERKGEKRRRLCVAVEPSVHTWKQLGVDLEGVRATA